MKQKQYWPFLIGPSVNQIEFILRILNSESEGFELKKLIEAWQASGPDLLILFRQDETLKKSIHALDCYIEPAGKGGKLIWMPKTAGRGPVHGKQAALSMFSTLIVHPMLDKFAGPCPRCSKYYLKKTTRQKVYCSRRCGAYQNALLATRKRREREHQEQLQKAMVAIKTWKPSSMWPNWKKWVTAQTDLTQKFLTRAVNNNELTPPPV